MIVLDASVGFKWFAEEAGSDLAGQILEEHSGKITVPDLFLIEVTAALVREANIEKASALLIAKHIERLAEMAAADDISPVRLLPDQIAHAAEIAITLGHPLKDCLYLALAMELGCPLVTADARFAAKAKGVYEDVRALGV